MSTTERQEHHERADDGPVWRVPEELRLRLLAALSAPPEPGPSLRMTYEAFLDWLDEDTVAEWVNGEVVMPGPVSFKHQEIAEFLADVLRLYARTFDLGVVCTAPFQMKLADSGREPDVLFLANEHRDRLKATYLDGPADVAVEVVSPESVGRDRGEKFYEYERAGIREYWVIDPTNERADFWRLDAGGKYQLIAPDVDGVYTSAAVPGFWLHVNWLWQDPLPAVDEALLEIGGEAYARRLIERMRKRGLLPDA